jgi:hypothetical protein
LILLKKGLITSYEKQGYKYFQFTHKNEILYWIYSKILYNPQIVSQYKTEISYIS